MNVYRILHFLSNVCFDKVVWAPAPGFFFFFFNPPFSALTNLYLVHSRNDVEISPDIPDRQNETHDGRTYGSKRHPYMANTDRIPRNSYMENATCS